MGNFVIQDNGKIKNKMGGRCPEGQITDPRRKRMERRTEGREERRRRLRESGRGCSAIHGTEILANLRK